MALTSAAKPGHVRSPSPCSPIDGVAQSSLSVSAQSASPNAPFGSPMLVLSGSSLLSPSRSPRTAHSRGPSLTGSLLQSPSQRATLMGDTSGGQAPSMSTPRHLLTSRSVGSCSSGWSSPISPKYHHAATSSTAQPQQSRSLLRVYMPPLPLHMSSREQDCRSSPACSLEETLSKSDIMSPWTGSADCSFDAPSARIASTPGGDLAHMNLLQMDHASRQSAELRDGIGKELQNALSALRLMRCKESETEASVRSMEKRMESLYFQARSSHTESQKLEAELERSKERLQSASSKVETLQEMVGAALAIQSAASLNGRESWCCWRHLRSPELKIAWSLWCNAFFRCRGKSRSKRGVNEWFMIRCMDWIIPIALDPLCITHAWGAWKKFMHQVYSELAAIRLRTALLAFYRWRSSVGREQWIYQNTGILGERPCLVIAHRFRLMSLIWNVWCWCLQGPAHSVYSMGVRQFFARCACQPLEFRWFAWTSVVKLSRSTKTIALLVNLLRSWQILATRKLHWNGPPDVCNNLCAIIDSQAVKIMLVYWRLLASRQKRRNRQPHFCKNLNAIIDNQNFKIMWVSWRLLGARRKAEGQQLEIEGRRSSSRESKPKGAAVHIMTVENGGAQKSGMSPLIVEGSGCALDKHQRVKMCSLVLLCWSTWRRFMSAKPAKTELGAIDKLSPPHISVKTNGSVEGSGKVAMLSLLEARRSTVQQIRASLKKS